MDLINSVPSIDLTAQSRTEQIVQLLTAAVIRHRQKLIDSETLSLALSDEKSVHGEKPVNDVNEEA